MKTLVIAAALALGLSSASQAADIAVVGNAEYAVEAQTFETNAGVEVGLGALTITPQLVFAGTSANFDFTGTKIDVSYIVSSNVNLYGKVEADRDFAYTETTLGVALRF